MSGSPGAFYALYRLLLRSQATRGRLFGVGALAVGGVLIAVAIGAGADPDTTQGAVTFADRYGLSLLIPVGSLLFASGALGDLREDGSLVYLWLRPVPRSLVVGAALAASLTITLPLLGGALVVSVAVVDPGVVGGTLAAAVVGLVTYGALFVVLGLRVQRALLWGLVYVLLWEGFVSRSGEAAARFSVASHLRSILTDATGEHLAVAFAGPVAAYLVPIAAALVALAYGVRRFQHQDVA